jgi:hypothetical protein
MAAPTVKSDDVPAMSSASASSDLNNDEDDTLSYFSKLADED